MTKSKSKIAILAVAIMMCVSLVLGFSFNKNTLTAYAESGNLPKIVSVIDKNNKVEEVDQVNSMLNMPVGVVGEPYYAKVITANDYDTVYIKSYAEGKRGCLPQGLVFNAETKEITGTPAESEAGVSRDVQIYCDNEYGSTNVRGWLNVYSADKKPTLTGEVPATAYVDSYYSAMVEVGGYNKSFKVSLKDNYPEGMNAYRNGVYACISFTPTSEMAGKTYNFKLCVDNELGVVTKDCTITVANGVVAPEFITETQPLRNPEDNPNGVRPVVGQQDFEFWLQASGTNTEDNPIEFFAYNKDTDAKATPNSNNEYDLGNGLFLTKNGKIYSNCVLEVEGQTEGSQEQIEFYIGASNKSTEGNEQGTGKTRCFLQIVKGYWIDSFTILPENTDIPKGGTRKFTAKIEGVGFEQKDLNITWDIWGAQDENTSIDSNGVVTIGINETGYRSGDLIGKLEVFADTMIGSTRKDCSQKAIITLADHIHTTSVVEAVAKTCTTDGNIKHYKCTICDSLFADAGATQNRAEADVKISAGHEYTEMVGLVASTCSTKGMQAHYRCKNCDKYFALGSLEEVTAESLEIAINPNGHNTTHEDGKNATCAETGIFPHEHCSLCNKNFYSDCVTEMVDIVEAKNDNHELETDWTATADGHYHRCNRTGCKDNGKVDFASHTKDRENATEIYPVKCTICGYIITPALAHTHHLTLVAGEQATCSQNGKKPYYTCDGCEDKFADAEGTQVITDEELVIPMAHSYSDLISKVEPTCSATGMEEHYECTVCHKLFDTTKAEKTNAELTIAIDSTAHNFGEWKTEVSATTERTGTKAHKDCEFCHKHFDAENNELTDAELVIPQLDKEPEKTSNKGLNGGAIAGIVIASVVVLSVGGFAIFWFVIKKKKWADLVNAIKNLFKKK